MELTEPEVIVLLPGDTFNLVNNTDHDGKTGEIIYIALIPKGYGERTDYGLIRQAVNIISKGKT